MEVFKTILLGLTQNCSSSAPAQPPRIWRWTCATADAGRNPPYGIRPTSGGSRPAMCRPSTSASPEPIAPAKHARRLQRPMRVKTRIRYRPVISFRMNLTASPRQDLEYLLGLDGNIEVQNDAGYWVKMEIALVNATAERPHGIKYAPHAACTGQHPTDRL